MLKEHAIRHKNARKSSNVTNIARKTTFGSALLIFFLMGLAVISPSLAEASLSVTVCNETGYDLEEVKYVQETGVSRSLTGYAQQLANGGAHTFRLKKGGNYCVYASFIMGEKKVYARGNPNNLRDGGQYRLTLKKVVFSQSGDSLNFIDRSEFDAIK